MAERTANCDACGLVCSLLALDSKPRLSVKLRLLRKFRGQIAMLQYAGDHGYNFDRLECAACYGPGYESLGLAARPSTVEE